MWVVTIGGNGGEGTQSGDITAKKKFCKQLNRLDFRIPTMFPQCFVLFQDFLLEK